MRFILDMKQYSVQASDRVIPFVRRSFDEINLYTSNKHQLQYKRDVGEIPQGSIIGPLLFLLYINDLPNYLNDTKCNMFADDTQIDRSSKDINTVVTNALNND